MDFKKIQKVLHDELFVPLWGRWFELNQAREKLGGGE
jgi:hypothetical protein